MDWKGFPGNLKELLEKCEQKKLQLPESLYLWVKEQQEANPDKEIALFMLETEEGTKSVIAEVPKDWDSAKKELGKFSKLVNKAAEPAVERFFKDVKL
jgi:hypothetical protein